MHEDDEHAARARGAVAELLWMHRSLIDEAVDGLTENAPLEPLLDAFQASVQSLCEKEPQFWQLRSAEYIYDALKDHSVLTDDGAFNNDGTIQEDDERRSQALLDAVLNVRNATKKALDELHTSLSGGTDSRASSADPDLGDCMGEFWQDVVVAMKEPPVRLGESVSELKGDFDSHTFDALTFDDDFQDDELANSMPSSESIPALVERMKGDDPADRTAALEDLSQIPTFEVLHYGLQFPDISRAVAGMFTDVEVDQGGPARHAKKQMYELVTHVEDPMQFLDIYWSVLEFMAEEIISGNLYLGQKDAMDAANARAMSIVDTYRVFLLLLELVPQHWNYFAPEALAKMFFSTFQLLNLSASSGHDPEEASFEPLEIIAMLADDPAWFQLWLTRCPSREQLFLVLTETGFVENILRQLAPFQPLEECSSNQVLNDAVNKKHLIYVIRMVSLACEYASGRELIRSRIFLPDDDRVSERGTSLRSCRLQDLDPVAEHNDRLFRLPLSDQQSNDQSTRKEAGYIEHDALSGVVLAFVSVLLLNPSRDNEETHKRQSRARWEERSIHSLAVCIAHANPDEILAPLIQVLRAAADGLGEDGVAHDPGDVENDVNSRWCPFTISQPPLKVCKMMQARILGASRVNKQTIQRKARRIMYGLLSSEQLMNKLVAFSPGTRSSVCQLWKYVMLDTMTNSSIWSSSRADNEQKNMVSRWQPTTMALVGNSDLTSLAKNTLESEALHFDACSNLDQVSMRRLGFLTLFSQSAAGFYSLISAGMDARDRDSLIRASDSHQCAHQFRQLLNFLTFDGEFAQSIARSDSIANRVLRGIAELRDSGDFGLALNSPLDECLKESRSLVNSLNFMRCCLNSVGATDAFSHNTAELIDSPIFQFIKDTLVRHNVSCGSSDQAEDTCCAALQFLIAVVGPISSKLACSKLLVELGVLNINDKAASSPPSPILRSAHAGIGPCYLLEHHLRYDLEHIGGPSERASLSSLYDFDVGTFPGAVTMPQTSGPEPVTDGANLLFDRFRVLHSKILSVLKDKRGPLATPSLDFGALSQLSWDLIAELGQNGSVAAATPMFGELLVNLVMSRRSKLEPTSLELSASVPSTNPGDSYASELGFPTLEERKMLNKLYKNYCQRLSLESSPTNLHCIVKQFGHAALDCFPTTILMAVQPTCKDDRRLLLAVLVSYYNSPLARFMWPSTTGRSTEPSSPPGLTLAIAVEWVLEQEYPQIVRAVATCQCTVAALVARWNSQCFWNYLDWDQIVQIVYMSSVYGIEFQVFVLVVLLKHLERVIRQLGSSYTPDNLEAFLKLIQQPIAEFRIGEWQATLLHLYSKYNDQVLEILMSTSSTTT